MVKIVDNELTNFLNTYHEFSTPLNLYSGLDKLLTEFYKTNPLIIYSYPSKSKKKIGLNKCRVLWNKQKIDNNYKNSQLGKIFENYDFAGEANYTSMQIENLDQVYLIRIGKRNDQDIFGIFSTNSTFENDQLMTLIDYLKKYQKGVEEVEKYKSLEKLVYIDEITGLYNQRKLHVDIEHFIDKHKKHNQQFVVLFIDIDHFKSVNDGHGHLVGTQLLQSVGELLKAGKRDSDHCYRYGGDEFVMLVAQSDNAIGKMVGERILNNIKNHDFKIVTETERHDEFHFKLSVSIGVACFPVDAQNKGDILDIADKTMYEAKNDGRGVVRVVVGNS